MLKKETKNTEQHKEFASLLNDTTAQTIENRIVKGMVLEVRPTEVLVDIGAKGEGTLSANEFADISAVKPGDEVDVLVLQSEADDGMPSISKRAADEKIKWEAVFRRYQEGSIVKGEIVRVDDDNVLVDVNFKSEGQIPASEFRDSAGRDRDPFLVRSYRGTHALPERRQIRWDCLHIQRAVGDHPEIRSGSYPDILLQQEDRTVPKLLRYLRREPVWFEKALVRKKDHQPVVWFYAPLCLDKELPSSLVDDAPGLFSAMPWIGPRGDRIVSRSERKEESGSAFPLE